MAEQTAEVMLEQGTGGTDRILTYRVPAAMVAQVRPGVRVAVPMGAREHAGIVLSLNDPSCLTDLRPIAAVLDGEPMVTEERARLADWLTERYLCRRCDAWRLFLPPGVTRKGFRRLHLNAPWGEIQQRLSHFILPPDEADRLTAGLASLGKGGGDPRKLRLALGPLYQQIGILVKQGYLVWREPWQKKSPAARRVSFVRCGRRPERLTPKQERVWAYLAANDGRAVARAEILAACGVGPAVLGRMVDQGVLLAEEKRVRRVPLERDGTPSDHPVTLYPAQEDAVAWVRQNLGSGRCMLLHGVTGSGKTEVYLRALALGVEAGMTGLLLVPEIGLTPQTVERVVARFGGRVAVLHSRLSIGERQDEWDRIRIGEADVVVGPRSALFAPLARLGVVILDEEHDQAYKQEDGLRYHAREVAMALCRLSGAVLIMGSATPSLEAMVASERGEATYLPLPERPGGRALPRVELVESPG